MILYMDMTPCQETENCVITTPTMCEVIKSWGVRNHGTVEVQVLLTDTNVQIALMSKLILYSILGFHVTS